MAPVTTTTVILIIVAVVVVLLAILATGLILARRRRINLTEKPAEKPSGYQAGGGISLAKGGRPEAPEHPVADRTETDGQPAVGDDAAVPRDAGKQTIVDVGLPDAPTDAIPAQAEPPTDAIPAQAEPVTDALPAQTAVADIAPAEGRLERLR